jgi:sec-independent protein translocase protein TatC
MNIADIPIQAHLDELRRRLITCAIFMAATFVLSYIFSDALIAFLFTPVYHALPENSKMVFTALTEGFITYLKVAFWAALILTTPVILYQIWAFVAPGLYPKEKKVLKTIIISGISLFAAGGIFGHWVIMPVILSFSLGFASQGLEAMPRLQDYLLFALKSIFTFGIVFELPFLMAATSATGIVSVEYFRKNRKASYLALYLIAVMICPADIFSQVLLFLPIAAVFESGILLGRFFSGKKKAE